MEAPADQDLFEKRGFKYNEETFESLFSKPFNEGLDASTESSEEEEEQNFGEILNAQADQALFDTSGSNQAKEEEVP
jgi:hypothetical protein